MACSRWPSRHDGLPPRAQRPGTRRCTVGPRPPLTDAAKADRHRTWPGGNGVRLECHSAHPGRHGPFARRRSGGRSRRATGDGASCDAGPAACIRHQRLAQPPGRLRPPTPDGRSASGRREPAASGRGGREAGCRRGPGGPGAGWGIWRSMCCNMPAATCWWCRDRRVGGHGRPRSRSADPRHEPAVPCHAGGLPLSPPAAGVGAAATSRPPARPAPRTRRRRSRSRYSPREPACGTASASAAHT